MKKKLLLLVTCFTALFAVLAACGNSYDGSNQTDADANLADSTDVVDGVSPLGIAGFPLAEPLDVLVYGPHVGNADWGDMAFWQALSEDTNINFTFDTPPNEDFITSLNLTIVTSDFPDVFFGSSLTAAQQMELGEDGILLPLQDLIREHAPNLQRLMDENPDIVNSITAPDGNIYALPTFSHNFDAIWPVGPVYYNGLWLEALNADVPETLDEFTDLMLRFRDEMPEILGVDRVFPISATDDMMWLRAWMLSFWGMTARASQATDGVVVHNVTTENYRAYLEWMHWAMQEDILHPEILNLSGDAHGALGADNLVGFFQAWHSHHFLQTDYEQAMTNPMVRPIISEYSPNGVLPRSPGFSFGQFAITYRAADPVALIRIADWLYTVEGSTFANYGPENAFWRYDTHAVTGEQVRVLAGNEDVSRGLFTPFYGFPAPTLGTPLRERVLTDVYTDFDPTFIEWLETETNATIGTYGVVAFPPAMLTFDEVLEIMALSADLNIEIDRMEAEFILGTTPINDDTWEAFQQILTSIGIERFVEIQQGAHSRWLANSQ